LRNRENNEQVNEKHGSIQIAYELLYVWV